MAWTRQTPCWTHRSSADLEATAAKVLAYVRANAGQRLEEIGRGLRTATAELTRPVQALLAAGSLRTEGQKRGTRYFAGEKSKTARKRARKARRSKARRRVAKKARRTKATRTRARRGVASKAPGMTAHADTS